jgi:iron complex outermembrane recepter protein
VKSKIRRLGGQILAILLALCLCVAQAQEPVAFDVKAGPAARTLNEFARQAELLHLIDPEQFRGINTHQVHGEFPIEVGLELLLKDTGITYTLSSDRAHVDFAIGPMTSVVAPKRNATRSETQSQQPASGDPKQEQQSISNVTVTGTRLHREDSVIGAQVLSFDESDIRQSGANSVAAFLSSLPQSFGSGPTPDTRLGAEAEANTGLGWAVNLRGLGAGAVLVLLNGQRLAPSGDHASFTDVANIPLAAVERVEVLLDSASPQYGSDAIAGVVNVITRDGTKGPVSFAQWDSVTSGSEHTGTFYQTLTRHWGSGNFIVSFGGSHQSPLGANDRGYYSADLRYGGGPNLEPPASYLPTLSNLSGTQSWALTSGNIPHPAVGDFKPYSQNLQNPYQDYQVIAGQQPLGGYTRLFQQINDWLSVSIDGIANRRRASQEDGPQLVSATVSPGSPYYVNVAGNGAPVVLQTNLLNLLGPKMTVAVVTVYGLSFQSDVTIGDSGNLSVTLNQSKERETQLTSNGVNNAAIQTAIQSPTATLNFDPYDQALDGNPTTLAGIRSTSRYDSVSQLQNITLSLDGPLVTVPGGPLRGEVGIELRYQRFLTRLSENDVALSPVDNSARHVTAAFSEIRAPIVGPEMGFVGLKKLDLSLVVRREQYSDFGGASTPRGGVLWQISDGLTLSAAYSRSFRAPDIGDLDQDGNTVVAAQMANPLSPSTKENVLLEYGNNSKLRQERATEKTFGAQWRSSIGSSMTSKLALDYFAIRYDQRIQATQYSDQLLNNSEYAFIVERNPTLAELQSACTSGRYFGVAGTCLGSAPQAIINLQLNNVDALETRGFDFGTSFDWRSARDEIEWRVNGTYLFQYSETPYPGAPNIRLLNTDHNPVDLRFRSSLDWRRGHGEFSIAMNYTNHYEDTDTQPSRPIASLTTIDLQFRYVIGERGTRGAVEISAGAQNVTNRAPPFVTNLAADVGYDQENADPYGRTWFLNILKRW